MRVIANVRQRDKLMRYASFRCGPWGRPPLAIELLVKGLSLILPTGNPDFDSAYRDEVVNWWLEIDEFNVVQREIAFDSSDHAVAAAPLGENCGIFTDLHSAPKDLGPEVDPSSFEETWNRFAEEWRQNRYARLPK